MVDLTGQFIPDRFRVAIFSHGTVNRLPDIPLVSRATIGPQGQFPVIVLPEGGIDCTDIIAVARPFDRPVAGAGIVSILIFVYIDQAVGPKIYRVGAGSIASVILIWIKYLGRQGFPAAGRSTIEKPGPAFT